MRGATAVAALLLSASILTITSDEVAACSLQQFADNGRYVGGDLVVQAVRKADTIQIVRAESRRLFRRTYSDGQWFLQFGRNDVPEIMTEYVDEFVYEFVVVETIKGGPNINPDFYEQPPRIRAYGLPEWRDFYRRRNLDSTTDFRPNALPEYVLITPGHDGYVF
jgi:hypothetical protein